MVPFVCASKRVDRSRSSIRFISRAVTRHAFLTPFDRQYAETVLINTTGGLTDGDSLACTAEWGPDSAALITTQAAERIYKSRSNPATIVNEIRIGERAAACWLPQETIVFDHGRVNRATSVQMAAGSQLFAAEIVVFGRTAMGEVVQSGRLNDRWQIRIDNRLVFSDSVLFDDSIHGNLAAHLARKSVADGANCMATVMYCGDDCDERLRGFREAFASTGTAAGASNLGRLVVARALASDSRILRDAVARVFNATQSFDLPRVWNC